MKICSVKDSHIPAIRRLVNAAYKELGDRGLNYTATFQDEEITRNRISVGRGFIIEEDGQILGTVVLTTHNRLTGLKTAYIGQLAVDPKLQKRGLGFKLLQHCEELARTEGYEGVQLDTAKPAQHLIDWYHRCGYKIVGEYQFDGKTYESWIFEKVF